MSSSDPFPADELDQMLSPRQMPDQKDLRDAVLQETARIVRRRRRSRTALLVAAMLVCYTAGVATVQLWNRSGGNTAQPMAHQPPPHAPSTAPGAADPRRASELAQSTPLAPKLSSYERLCRYSDRLLQEEGEIARAARYYALALDQASAEERAISVEDTWLLMALKADRFPEKNHENHGS